jgi:hypothetical protein
MTDEVGPPLGRARARLTRSSCKRNQQQQQLTMALLALLFASVAAHTAHALPQLGEARSRKHLQCRVLCQYMYIPSSQCSHSQCPRALSAPAGSKEMRPSERIYFHSWSVGEECGSDKIPGCRDAATTYLTNSSNMGFATEEIAIFVTVGLSDAGGNPVDLTTQGLLKGKNFSQIGAVCRPGPLRGSEAVSLTLMPGFTVGASAGGCLGTETLGHKSDARAFVAAHVTPPNPTGGMLGGEVQGCPKGLCVIGLHAPDGAIASSAAATVKKVCGDMVSSCVVAVGDFGDEGASSDPMSPNPTLDARLNEQFHQLGIGKLYSTSGFSGTRAAMNIINTGLGMNIGGGHPLSAQFGNITGQGPSAVLDVLLPCAYPETFKYCKK